MLKIENWEWGPFRSWWRNSIENKFEDSRLILKIQAKKLINYKIRIIQNYLKKESFSTGANRNFINSVFVEWNFNYYKIFYKIINKLFKNLVRMNIKFIWNLKILYIKKVLLQW